MIGCSSVRLCQDACSDPVVRQCVRESRSHDDKGLDDAYRLSVGRSIEWDADANWPRGKRTEVKNSPTDDTSRAGWWIRSLIRPTSRDAAARTDVYVERRKTRDAERDGTQRRETEKTARKRHAPTEPRCAHGDYAEFCCETLSDRGGGVKCVGCWKGGGWGDDCYHATWRGVTNLSRSFFSLFFHVQRSPRDGRSSDRRAERKSHPRPNNGDATRTRIAHECIAPNYLPNIVDPFLRHTPSTASRGPQGGFGSRRYAYAIVLLTRVSGNHAKCFRITCHIYIYYRRQNRAPYEFIFQHIDGSYL